MPDRSATAARSDDRPPAWSVRRRIIILAALALLPLALTAIAQPFLPDSVPVHYGLSGPDDWGPKGELFVVAGMIAATGLLVTVLHAVFAHQRTTGRKDWIVFNDSALGGASFSPCAVVLAVLAAAQAAYVTAAFGLAGFAFPENGAQLLVDAVCGLVVLVTWGFAAYMLVTGKSLLALRSEPTDLELRTGDDKRQARAVGVLLLLLSVFVIVEWALTR